MHQEIKEPQINGCWHSHFDTLKFETNGSFIYTGLSSYGWVSESKGSWRYDAPYFILNGDSIHTDSLDKINRKAVAYGRELIKSELNGKTIMVPRAFAYDEVKPLYRNFRNEHYRMQGDTLLLQINENGFEENRFTKCEFNTN